MPMPVMNSGQEKTIETANLFVKNNLMCFGEVRLQIANIASIADGKEYVSFPTGAIYALVAGALLYMIGKQSEMFSIIGLVLGLWGAALIVAYIIQKNKGKSFLIITMNSGQTYKLEVYSDTVLDRILDVLETIIMNGGAENKIINIDLQNAKINAAEFKMDTVIQ